MRIRTDIEPLLVATRPENVAERITAMFLNRVESARTYLPVVDAYYGVETDEDQTAERVRVLMSVFVGHFLMALVCDEKTLPPLSAIMRVMGWGGPETTQSA